MSGENLNTLFDMHNEAYQVVCGLEMLAEGQTDRAFNGEDIARLLQIVREKMEPLHRSLQAGSEFLTEKRAELA